MKRKCYFLVVALLICQLLSLLPVAEVKAESALFSQEQIAVSEVTDASQNSSRKALSEGVQNIVKRAYQMTNIQWTPKADIYGWASELVYKAGTTYTGLPYGQPVNASYVPWSTDLNGFLAAVNDSTSKMYTSYSSYNERAPYYSIDCSAFVSWAWGLPSRQTTSSIANYATLISKTSYADMEVGDCFNKAGSHVVLVTDITYTDSGEISAVEISESTVNAATNYCCQRTWYGNGYSNSLADMQAKYLDSGYYLYRCNTRDSVTYTHSCASPLEGDSCFVCGYGSIPSESVYATVTITADTAMYEVPDATAAQIGTVYAGTEQTIIAYAVDNQLAGWFKTDQQTWIMAERTEGLTYQSSVRLTGKSFPESTLASGSFFPIQGEISSVNPLSQIDAAIYKKSDLQTPVQQHTEPLSNVYYYSLRSSPVDYAMEFNTLSDGEYIMKITVTERAYCSVGPEAKLFSTAYESEFSVGTSQVSGAYYKGIDVSHHQGTIDWDAASAQIDFAILRCGYGDDMQSQDDGQWERNASECERLSIPYGVYIYSYALTDEQALSEAQHVLRLLQGHNPALPVFLDLEDSGTVGTLSNAEILRHTQMFCDAISQAGYSVGVYASYSWWTTRLTDTAYNQWARWVARWGVSSSGYEGNCIAWQYSDSGSVAGISGNVDMNYWYGELSAVCDHSYDSEITVQASCNQPGEIRYNCTKCGHQYTQTIAQLAHEYETQVVAPTCQNNGYTLFTCKLCGDSYIGEETEIVDHKFENGTCVYCGERAAKVGDINDDGVISTADSVLLMRYLADLIDFDDRQLLAADVNGDGAVTTADSAILARYLANLITELK